MTADDENYPSVTVIILTWNGKDLVLDCVKSLQKCTYPNFKIIVVDNASQDSTVDALQTAFGDSIEIISNPRNEMYAGGNNVGIRRALVGDAEWLLLLNNDVEVDPGLLDALVSVGTSDLRIGIVGPKIYFREPPDMVWFAGGELSLWGRGSRHIGIRQIDQGQFDRIRDVDYVTGCALLIRRSVIDEIGLLDESFRMYNEDADWCLRAREAGYRVLYTPEGKLWHKISSSAGGQLSLFKIRHRVRSQWLFLKKHAKWYHWIGIPFGAAVEIARVLLLAISGKFQNSALPPAS